MLRKIVILFLVFMAGMFVSGDYAKLSDKVNNHDSKIDGNIWFSLSANTNDAIAHKPDESEAFKITKNVDGVIHYSLGARTRNDQLVASGGQNQSWPIAHNVKDVLTYPTQGYGAQVTYVAIVVNQTSNLGQAYVIKGGINQHSISIAVEAYNTNVFNVFAYVYGI